MDVDDSDALVAENRAECVLVIEKYNHVAKLFAGPAVTRRGASR